MFKFNDPAATPAKFQLGDWAYNNLAGHNARVVGVVWDKALYGYAGGWRYAVPGLSDPDMYRENPAAPYVQYVQVDEHCWRKGEVCTRDDQNIAMGDQA